MIVPVYNASRYINECINSLINQSYPNIEIIVVDDGSTDDSLRVLQSYSSIVVLRQKNKGASAARNYGLSVATGELVQFLDADDYIGENKIEIQVKQWMQMPDSQTVVFGPWTKIGVAVENMGENQKSVWHNTVMPCICRSSQYLPMKPQARYHLTANKARPYSGRGFAAGALRNI